MGYYIYLAACIFVSDMADVELLLKSTQQHLHEKSASETEKKGGLRVCNVPRVVDPNKQDDLKTFEEPPKDTKVAGRGRQPGKENGMKRSTSMSVSSRGRKRAEKKDSCCNGYASGTTSLMRRCFSDADNTSSSRTSEDTNDTDCTSNSSSAGTERSSNASPSKELQEAMEAPPSPNANLRMLFSAVSPEIRKMQNQKMEEQKYVDVVADGSSLDTDVMSSQDSDYSRNGLGHGSRKDKSLGLLCYR